MSFEYRVSEFVIKKSLYILTLLFAFLHSCFAQDLLQSKKAYISKKTEEVSITIEGDSLKIVKHFYLEKVANTDDAEAYMSHDIHFSPSWQEIKNLKTEVLTPKGKKFKSLAFDNAEIKSNFSSNIFFDDSRYIKITAPKVYKNQRVVIEYDEVIKNPMFLDPFIVSSYIPTESCTYSISYAKGIEVNSSFFNLDDTTALMSIGNNGNKSLSWSFKNIKPYQVNAGAPSIRYYEPHLVPYIASYTINDHKTNVLSSVDDLFAWYADLTKSVNTELSSELKQIADSVSSTHQSPHDKAKSIFYWVQDNIRYIAFEDGMGGFVPREASLVCSRRFGDCKDMSSITTAMLNHIGLDAHLTWVGSRDIPYSYNQVHTLTTDNHMIASVKINGETTFLDATSGYGKYGHPSGFTQGKQALIRLSDSEYELIYVPVIPATENTFTDSNQVSIDLKTNNLIGTSSSIYTGLSKFNSSWALRGKSEAELTKLLNGRLSKGSNRFLIDDFNINNLNDRDSPLSIQTTFNIQDYIRQINDQLFINLNLSKPLVANKLQIDHRGSVPYEFDYKYKNTFVQSLSIPKGYRVKFVPENSSFKDEAFGFSTTYIQTENDIQYTLTVWQDQLLMTEEKFKSWNDMIDMLSKEYANNIILKKI